jgi:dihydroorotase
LDEKLMPMKLLFKNVTITDKGGPHHGKTTDILVENGVLSKVGDALKAEGAEVVDAKGWHVAVGFMDLCASFCDPGLEHKETLETGAQAALQGGYTHVLVMPSTQPVVSGKTQVEYIVNRGKSLPVNIMVCGSLSSKMDGENLSEMYDMQQAGAVAFYDHNHYVRAGLMSRALLYAKNFGGRIFSLPFDASLAPGGLMHEGVAATTMGLKGIPEISEEIVVMRDLALAEYNNAPVHFAAISSPRSLELIREARKKNIQVTAQIPAYQFSFTDEDLTGFDTHLKVIPPFRTATVHEQLVEGLKDNTITALASFHHPEDPESKTVEFDHAENGMIGLETAFASAWTALQGKVDLDVLVEKFTNGPRRVLGFPEVHISEGIGADLTFFDPQSEFTFTTKHIASRSKNSPFIGKTLKGQIKGVVTKGHWSAL